MGKIDFKIDDKTEEYLKNIREKTGDKSLSLTAKNLVIWCLNHGLDPSKNPSFFDEETRKMIEHIHLSIPHLMLSSSVSSLVAMSGLDDEKSQKISEIAIKRLNQRVGDFQNINYKTLSVTINNTGIKQAPEDEEISEWR